MHADRSLSAAIACRYGRYGLASRTLADGGSDACNGAAWRANCQHCAGGGWSRSKLACLL